MLGVLLDNAIESRTKKVIFIEVSSLEEGLYISVSNEYKRKSKDDFNKMFQKGYSTKSRDGRGHGLYNLSKNVNKYGGNILLYYEYNQNQKSDYLTIKISVNN